ncbi:MAG: MerR family transcriptional regulator [Lachnospiraceae bacterium]|nr:MerR family transcriptional regulator [Lachnospiraceae bacterium]
MMTVKEISKITGISVRTLHYYDEIGLLKPTDKSEAGYRLYDDKALETLQQILFFREFDIPLKEIKSLMENPALERNQILQMQRKMLVAKKERMERLIASIDNILKGERKMDFTIFSKTELEELAQISIERMPDYLKECIIKEFGSLKQWKEHYVERASKEDMQKGYQKMIEWYGNKERALNYMKNPPSSEIITAYKNRTEAILQKLIQKKDMPADSFAVKEIIGEYAFVIKQFLQVKHEKGVMLNTAASYKDERLSKLLDDMYGEGASEFFVRAIEEFYKDEL